MLRLRADARRSTQFDDRRLFSAGESDRTRCTKNSAVSRAEMCGAGLSSDLRDSTCFAQAGAQKNLGQYPALREKRDPEFAKRCKGAANRLHRNRKALLFLIRLDRTVERAKRESSASIETPLRPPAMFRVSVS